MHGKNIQVESIEKRDMNLVGTLLVRNISFQKHVFIRYTLSQWKWFSDLECIHVTTFRQHEISLDRFKFVVNLNEFVDEENDLEDQIFEFAACYEVNGHSYWDNHDNLNYEVEFGPSFVKSTKSESDFSCFAPYWSRY
jgi:protein phosphatase 1 regulatory subunit 3A/B/C/D/E